MRGRGRILALAVAAVVILTAACAPPIGVRRLSPADADAALTVNVLSAGRASVYSARVLQRLALAERYERDPIATLGELHAGLGGYDEADRLLALAELSFLHARETETPENYMASAVYAWAFMNREDLAETVNALDDRVRLAADLYNRGIVLAMLADKRMPYVDLSSRRFETFFGSVEIEVDPGQLVRHGYRLDRLISLTDLQVHGLRNRYRTRGLGAPLAASSHPLEDFKWGRWVAPTAKIGVTMVIRFPDSGPALADGNVSGVVRLYDPDEQMGTLEREDVPLESDPSTAIAYRLNNSPVWDFELAGFRRGDFRLFNRGKDTGLFMLEPFDPELIPVVFVHGTASSPARWAEMGNELLSDRRIASKYQFWFYLYHTGNPVAYSASGLRNALRAIVETAGPTVGADVLNRMVLIGHSQGGLLVRMMVVDSGERFWEAASDVPFEEVEFSAETRALVRDALFVEPLPFVERAIFISTPHHGSFVAENWIGNLARKLISFPSSVVRAGADIASLRAQGVLRRGVKMPTSVDNMRGSHPFMRTLSSLPIDPHVRVNSIIPVKGDGPVEEGNDGVVTYKSAHLDSCESELVVRWSHSVQGHPMAIEEVRRILWLHAEPDSDERAAVVPNSIHAGSAAGE